jgi:hypothetical protein
VKYIRHALQRYELSEIINNTPDGIRTNEKKDVELSLICFIFNYLVQEFLGEYGTNPKRIIISMLVLMGLFAIFYYSYINQPVVCMTCLAISFHWAPFKLMINCLIYKT